MTKQEAIALIDKHKNALIDPVEMLSWTYLRVILANLPDGDWNRAVLASLPTLSS